MEFSDKELIDGVPKHNLRAVSRLITLIENRSPRARKIQKAVFKYSGKAHIVGITGAPGAGKSTLVDKLAVELKKAGKKPAVLAVDPSSPFTGGALLGDRIRMTKSAETKGIFIRSMASRGALGGVAGATVEVVQVLDAAGFDIVLVETVGVGQGEVDIVKTADTSVVVLVPGMGDGVQAMKAGILEIADLFVINKADREGADLLERDLRAVISMDESGQDGWHPPVLKTTATTGEGTSDLIGQLKAHKKWLDSSGSGQKRRLRNMKESIIRLALNAVQERSEFEGKKFNALVKECLNRTLDPFTAAERILDI